jgi:hypothetical protein
MHIPDWRKNYLKREVNIMKDIDIGDEVRVKNKQGIYAVERYYHSCFYTDGKGNETLVYTLKENGYDRTLIAPYEDLFPLKSMTQKIDEELDRYNNLIFLESIYKDGQKLKEAKFIMNFLKQN